MSAHKTYNKDAFNNYDIIFANGDSPEVEEVIEDIVIEEVTTEEVIEVIEQVNDIGVQNLDQATEEVQEVVQAVVEEAIEKLGG